VSEGSRTPPGAAPPSGCPHGRTPAPIAGAPRRSRRSAIGLALAALLLAGCPLAGCGGNGHGDASGVSAGGQTSQPEHRSLTRAQALAFARAVNLTAADLPGFRHSPKHPQETQREKRLTEHLRRCAGIGGSGTNASGAVAEQDSGSFRVQRDVLDFAVSSEVSVERGADLAARELAVIRSKRVRACFARYLDDMLKGQSHGGAALKQVSIQAGTPPAPGTTGSFGWRITEPFTIRGIRLSLYVDILGFVIGPARVTLVSSGAVRPFPAEVQQRLFALLLARARAHAS